MNESELGTYPDPTLKSTPGAARPARVRGRATDGAMRRISHVGPHHRPDQLPMSFAQERLWFLDRMGLVGSAYNRPLALRLSGRLNEMALDSAVGDLVARHEVLRTRFQSTDGRPYQVVDPPSPFQIHRVDLSSIPDIESREREVSQLISAQCSYRFDLSTGPLLRVLVAKLAPLEHILMITLHHIICDGWSIGIMLRELGQCYAAYLHNQPNPLPAIPLQYADYALWQREFMHGEALEQQLAYWRTQLAEAPSRLHLPTDRARPAVESFSGALVRFHIHRRLIEALESLGRRNNATLFMVLLASYQILLSRWSGKDDIIIGAPIAGRKYTEMEALIGLFVNTLALRGNLTGATTFKQVLERTRSVTLGAYSNQDLPFEKLVMELRPERQLNCQPIFQVGLALQNFPEDRLDLPGVECKQIQMESLTTHFELTLFLYTRPDGISGFFEYATDLFDRQTIERIAARFQAILERVAADPDCDLARLALLNDAERRTLVQWSSSQRFTSPLENVVEILQDQARAHPGAPAVLAAGRTITYAGLNAGASRLARALRQHGVRPGDRVGVHMERSPESLAAFYAILKARAVYVPLDPSHPRPRLIEICRDADISHIIIHSSSADLAIQSIDYIAAGELQDLPKATDDEEDFHSIDPLAPAYAIYTSGSTGTPKGVVLHHLGLANVIAAQRAAFALPDTERVLQLASVSFDASVFEFVLALGAGACLAIGTREELLPGAALTEFLARHDIGSMTITPTALSCLSPTEVVSVRTLIVAGEQFPVELARKWAVNRRVFNAYGPTETTIWATVHDCSRDRMGDCVPIGRPIDNMRAHVLGSDMQPVGIGEVGELYIGGPGVATGYINRPDLTAERFVDDPVFLGEGKVYRTGDLARWRADATLEFIGRSDSQVKIRGARIETGEIEATLLEHPAVKQAAVTPKHHASGDRHLIACIVPYKYGQIDTGGNLDFKMLRKATVDEWQSLYHETYARDATAAAPSFAGWNSSYTGLPIPDQEMQEWLAATVEQIHALTPNRVLEIGCGSGLVLQHVAPRCLVYVGTDFSAAAVANLRRWATVHDDLRHVELLHRSATELDDVPSESFDTIILNSVVQYFPDLDYLFSVLKVAVRLLRSGGKIFIGDVRDLRLLTTFHSSVQLSRAAATVNVGQLRRRIARSLSQERELLLDSELFRRLPGNLSGITAAQVYLKSGRCINELTRYRYDVVLRKDDQIMPRAICTPIPWASEIGGLSELESALREQRWASAHLIGVPNERLVPEIAARRLIDTSHERCEVGALRSQLSQLCRSGIDPDQLRRLAEAHDYDITVSPGEPGCFDVRLLSRSRRTIVRRTVQANEAVREWDPFANSPLENLWRQRLVPALREHLLTKLPEHMIPSGWLIMDSLPFTSSGKVDRKQLATLETDCHWGREYEAPVGETEEKLAVIWQELLQVDRAGRHDNFFELGGHSLLAVRVLASVNQRFGTTLKVLDLYQNPTIHELAQRLSGGSRVGTLVSLAQEAVLDSTIIRSSNARARIPPSAVLVTGATGFVGRFLTAQLLQETDVMLYCLVRANSSQDAMSRLRGTLFKWDLWRDEFSRRIVPVPGDLTLPGLGIDKSSYAELCHVLDSIYHCGTTMNHLASYAMARAANIEGTKELLRLAAAHSPKVIHHVSSLGIFTRPTDTGTRTIREDTPIDHEKHLPSRGYIASKWVAEKLFMIARERNIPCNIFRVGLAWADSQLGRYDELQWAYRLIKSCLLARCAIRDYHYEIAPTPVDYIARSIFFLSNRHVDGGNIFHISSAQQTSQGLFEMCNTVCGTDLELVTHYDWIQNVKRLQGKGIILPHVPLIEFAFSMDEATFDRHQRALHSGALRFDCERTHQELERAGIIAPVLDEDLLVTCIDSMLSRDPDFQEHAYPMHRSQ